MVVILVRLCGRQGCRSHAPGRFLAPIRCKDASCDPRRCAAGTCIRVSADDQLRPLGAYASTLCDAYGARAPHRAEADVAAFAEGAATAAFHARGPACQWLRRARRAVRQGARARDGGPFLARA